MVETTKEAMVEKSVHKKSPHEVVLRWICCQLTNFTLWKFVELAAWMRMWALYMYALWLVENSSIDQQPLEWVLLGLNTVWILEMIFFSMWNCGTSVLGLSPEPEPFPLSEGWEHFHGEREDDGGVLLSRDGAQSLKRGGLMKVRNR